MTMQILCVAYALIAGAFAASVTTRADSCGLRAIVVEKQNARLPHHALIFGALWIGIYVLALLWPLCTMHRVTTAQR